MLIVGFEEAKINKICFQVKELFRGTSVPKTSQ
jgi:hypothetical protein